eukprot:m.35162 g.35162  ORF g.35162 m.35162 type:complete len:209 (+) comp32072_c0_seq3:132-758(+)
MAGKGSEKGIRNEVFLCSPYGWNQFTSEVFDILQLNHIQTFYKPRSIEWGDSTSDRLNKAIRESRYAVVIISREVLEWSKADVALKSMIDLLTHRANENRIIFLPALTPHVKQEDIGSKWPLLSLFQPLLITDSKDLAQRIVELVSNNQPVEPCLETELPIMAEEPENDDVSSQFVYDVVLIGCPDNTEFTSRPSLPGIDSNPAVNIL